MPEKKPSNSNFPLSLVTKFFSWKPKPILSTPDNHISYSQLINYLWHHIKNVCFSLLKLVIFLVVLVDGLLGLATIIYIIDGNYVFAVICWIGISTLAFQFISVLEKHKPNSKFTRLDAGNIFFAAILGSIAGIIIWPAFDKNFGLLIGSLFGALFGISLKLIIEIIWLDLRQNKL